MQEEIKLLELTVIIGLQVLVQVKYAGVNPVDTYIRGGSHTNKPALPYTPGLDGAGIVQEVGEEVTKLKVLFCCYLQLNSGI